MNLDARINKLSDILTCVNVEEAKKYIGQKGFFADHLYRFEDLDDLSNAQYDTLANVEDNNDLPFLQRHTHWRYFLPKSSLNKPIEIKYVPFETTHDLAEVNLHLGCIINFINTKFPDVIHRAVINEVTYDDNTNELIDITLGNTTYSFELLFNDYQFLGSNGKWVLFGKKVKE